MNSNKKLIGALAGLFGVSGALAGAGAAYAQGAPDATGRDTLEEIVVTAQKRSENLQEVPITITLVDAPTIAAFHIQDLTGLSQLVPGLHFNTTGNANASLRGFSVTSSGPWQEPAVATYIDGVYFLNGSAATTLLNNIASVEVDNGPQGTFYGRNTIGGDVSITTKDPQQTPGMDVSAGYGNYNTVNGSFYGTTGIASNLAADLSISIQHQGDGWGTNLYDGSPIHLASSASARTKWLWTPGDLTKVTFSGDWSRAGNPVAGFELERGIFPFAPQVGPLHNGGFYDTYESEPGTFTVEQWGGSLTVDHDFGWSKFASITAVRRNVSRQNPVQEENPTFLPATPWVGQLSGNKVFAYAVPVDTMKSEELRLLSRDSARIQWVAGAFILLDKSGFQPNNSTSLTSTAAITTIAYTLQTTKSYSVFAQATMPITASTKITVGARETSDDKSLEGYVLRNTAAAPTVYSLVPTLGQAANPTPNKTWGKFTYKAALDHDVSKDVLTYLSFATGFQSGFYSLTASAASPPTNPTTIYSYEAGVKSTFADDRVRMNVALFYNTIKNMVVSQIINNQNTQTNAAAGRIEGVDWNLTAKPTHNLTLNAGIEYIDAIYTDYQNAGGFLPSGNTFVAVKFDATGYPTQNSERLMTTTSANYVIPVGTGELSLNGSLTYHSGNHYDIQQIQVQPSHALVNASATWAPNNQWDVQLWSQNLANRQIPANILVTNIASFYSTSPPRTFGLRFGYHPR